MRILLLASAFLLLATALPPAGAAQEVYRWVDADGLVHFTQTAPRDRPYERVAPAGAGGRPSFYNPRRETARGEETPDAAAEQQDGEPALSAEQQQRQAELQAQAQARLAEMEETRRRNCEAAREQFRQFTTYARIRVADGEGGMRILGEEERAERIAEAEEAILVNCDDAG